MLKYKMGFAVLVAITVADAIWLFGMVSSNGVVRQPVATPAREIAETAAGKGESFDESQHRAREAENRVGNIPQDAESARVVAHVDGDTVRLVSDEPSGILSHGDETTVRLLEIDTPESVDPNSDEECYARKASKALRTMLPLGSQVWVKADQELLDPYDRTLLYLWTAEGTFVNLDMVRKGYGKAVLFEPNDEYIDQMRRAETRARSAGRGLWAACDYFGQPLAVAGQTGATHEPSRSPSGMSGESDPRFRYCSNANDAGYGNYVVGRDPEYDWYDDRDGDGIVCEF